MRPAAVLDLDGTLHPRTLGAQVLRELLKSRAAHQESAEATLAAVDSLADRSVSFRTTVDEVYTPYTAAISGLPHRLLVQAAHDAWQAERHAVFPFVRPLLARLTRRGHLLVLISGSPHELVAEVAADLGIPHFYGARVAVDEGLCQDRLEQAPGHPGEKLRCLAHLAAVGRPVAFEPDQELLAAAQLHGWPHADRATALRVCSAVS
ncbi:haloacid dehalogenase-like hydrolase [Streptomyces sp. NPDC004539]|uniref:HAD family hydrolase n=1 Tax=Streptomyces sp. NPDC004539 TaxID=3154280 RepID=UPI0033A84411